MNAQAEKRRFVRLNVLADVIYDKRAPTEQEKLTLTRNISKAGICLIVYELLSEGDVLDLNIYLPEDKEPIGATGRVVWVKEFIIGDPHKGRRYDVGIEFLKVSDEDLAKIDKCEFTLIKAKQ